MRRIYPFVTVLLLLSACATTGNGAGALTVDNVRANMSVPSDTGSFWMEITNNSATDDALVGAEFEGCGVIELHEMVMEGDVMEMHQVEGGQIPIPAGETVELKPGGLHIMCIDKAAPLEAGSSVTLVLQFANAGAIEVVAEVVAPGEIETDKDTTDMDEE